MKHRARRNEFIVFGYPEIHEDDINEVVQTLRSGWIGHGPKVRQFESLFKKYVGAKYAIALDSGTAALFSALRVLGIGRGDEVITTPMTYCATAIAILHTGATPVFVDVIPGTGIIDHEKIESVITSRSRAIIPVHIYGRPCNLNAIRKIAHQYKLAIIEDAAHCIEGSYNGIKIGNTDDMACFSFHANKNITTVKGGMITTNNPDYEKKIKRYRDCGLNKSAWEIFSGQIHSARLLDRPGFNFNMTDVQAALGISQMSRLKKNLAAREEIWREYDKAFNDLPLSVPERAEKNLTHARHLYTLRLEKNKSGISRDRFRKGLYDLKVSSGIHYISLHLHPYFIKQFGFTPEDFPVACHISNTTTSLPLYPGLMESEVEYIIYAVKRLTDT